MVEEKFVPIQIDQELCMKCERCLHACQANAIYFEHSVRLIDYQKCRGCLVCVQVCPRNAIQVTSVEPEEIVNVKIDHEKCSMCRSCLEDSGKFCPKHLFYLGEVRNGERKTEGIRFKYQQIEECQSCGRCESLCPEGAIKPIRYKG